MIFIGLAKFRKKPTKEATAFTDKWIAQLEKQGVKVLGFYWTLGRYDSVLITEGPNEGAVERAMKGAIGISDNVVTETLVALRREDAVKLLD